jgi:hypothetical protein
MCFRPGGSNQQLFVRRMSVYIDRFYSVGSLYTFTVVSYRGNDYIVSYTIVKFVCSDLIDVLISGTLQIGPAALLVPAPQPLYTRKSGVVSVFRTVLRLVGFAHLAF